MASRLPSLVTKLHQGMSKPKPITRLPPLPSTKELLRLYNVRATKALSQNFLLDPKLTNKFVSKAGNIRDAYVCEVGPGPGNITRSILNHCPQHVIVIEKDTRFMPALSLLQDASKGRMSVVFGDVLNFEMGMLFPKECKKSWDDECPPIHLVGNLPFSISLPLIIKWLKAISERSSVWKYGRAKMTLTFQEEVAIRMTVPAGHEERCRLSLMCQNWCEVEHKFTIPGSAFYPKPRVNVGVVTLTPRISPLVPLNFPIVEKVLRHLFNTKNKMCKNPLKKLFPLSKREELTAKLMTVADVDPTITPVNLTMEELHRLTMAYDCILEQYPSLRSYDNRDKKNNEATGLFDEIPPPISLQKSQYLLEEAKRQINNESLDNL
uniref:rRNA adenine N(6)-methyltransferase n=1 Tax=Hirondellea gigas TaxID=1518452 RepID=A0A2P2I1E2_9CRUS